MAENERIFAGEIASRGLVLGTTELHSTAQLQDTAQGSPEEERSRLESAIAEAEAALTALAQRSVERGDETGADVLEFQIALLGDPELVAPALARIEGGSPAIEAWGLALDDQIEDYRSAEDEYFQARALDLEDLKARVSQTLSGAVTGSRGELSALDDPIYLARDLTPSRFLEIDWSRYRGAALLAGSTSSHVAILARARGIPLLVGLGVTEDDLPDGAAAVLDANPCKSGGGRLVVNPAADTRRRYAENLDRVAAVQREEAALLDEPAVTADGQAVEVMINIDEPSLLDQLTPAHCDGIGLTRTEFLFHGVAELPDEEQQLAVYQRLLDWAEGRPVTIRTLDAGGDKPIPGLTPEGDGNPFLGVRGLRLSLARPDVFGVQLRALARAAAGPNGETLKVMLPMVTLPSELEAARSLFSAAVEELRNEGREARLPTLGIMVEVPAAALDAATFDTEFYSIGSNDLTQYVMAAARDNSDLGALNQPRHPAVLELIGRVFAKGEAAGRQVSLCGDMASDEEGLQALLDLGLRRVSIAPAALGRVKAAISRYRSPGQEPASTDESRA